MTDTADPVATLSDAAQDALVDLVIRGMHRGERTAAQDSLVDLGLAVVKGPLIMPVGDAGAVAGAALRIEPGSAAEARVRALLEAFLPVNRRLRDLCTAWQCRSDGSANDHSDAAYDADVRDQLDDVHDAVLPILQRLVRDLPATERYPAGLERALERLDGGELGWFASPVLESYHTVWMQLHQELLLCLGMTREEDEALEARLVAELAG
jgi:hypothetical protein